MLSDLGWLKQGMFCAVYVGVELQQYHPSDVAQFSPLLYFEGDYSITLTDSHFSNINASNWTALPQPLSMFSNTGSVNFTNIFSSNCTTVEGSLFQFNVSSPASVSISDSSFSNAFTAVAVQHSSVSMTNITFENVTQTSIITQLGTSIDIRGCNFSNGGLLYISAPNITIHQSEFHNNTAETDGQSPENPPGGAISITSQIWDPDNADYFSGTYTISDCLFVNNSATTDMPAGTNGAGGAIIVVGSQGSASDHFTLLNCTLIGNSAVVGGGLSTWGVANVVVSGCNFQQNVATANKGAAIYAYGLELKLTCVFIETSNISQSTFSEPSESNCDVMFESCRCAGASFSHFKDSLGTGLCFVDVQDGECDASISLPSGALSFAFGSYAITSSDPLVGSNTEAASFLGDVDSLASGIVVDVRDCSFSNHTCTSQPSLDPFLGGAGVRIESASIAVLTRLVFEDNYARQGAGLHLKAVDTTLLWDSSFSNNVAAREGGAIALVDTGEAGLLIGATNVTNCTALIGGAVYGGAGTAIAVTNGSVLNGNKALTHGGAVYCDGCQSFATHGSTVVSWNEAQQSGGGGYFDMGLLISMEECFVSNNRCASLCWLKYALLSVVLCPCTLCNSIKQSAVKTLIALVMSSQQKQSHSLPNLVTSIVIHVMLHVSAMHFLSSL